MNQSLIAGIGNVYSDEVLFQLGLHPRTGLRALDPDALRSVWRVMRRVLRHAVRWSVDPRRFPDHYLLPHREGDGRCPRCRGPIRGISVSGRQTRYCPRCQGAGR
jgi:formamidopyrimidine-DNA glycosylase